MAKEIERKFLVSGDGWLGTAGKGVDIAQGYLSTDPRATVRVRVAGDAAFSTVKGQNDGAVRNEWEYAIPLADAVEMLRLCSCTISKTRYRVPASAGLTWEVDVYHGRHHGLVTAEVEIPSPDTEVDIPDWIEMEVTGNPEYYNSVLAQH